MWSVPLVTSSHWLYNFVCLFDSFAVIIFYFIRTPCEPTESFRCFFPIPVFTEALKGFFSFLHFFPVKKSLNVFYCYSFNYLFPCVNPSDISFVSFQEKFLSLCVFFSQFHTLKKCLFLCHFARDFLFFPLWKKKVLHITAKSKKNEKDSSGKTLFSFLVGRGFYSFLTFKKHFPY